MKQIFFILLILSCAYFAKSQVSYQSKPIQSNPYVAPVDLNLLQRVNSQKQETYNSNLKLLQDEYKQCSRMLKHTKDENYKTCLAEYNKIVNTANANDLSDAGIVDFLLKKLETLENTIDYVIDHPDALIKFGN